MPKRIIYSMSPPNKHYLAPVIKYPASISTLMAPTPNMIPFTSFLILLN